jgi:hypothetical protein
MGEIPGMQVEFSVAFINFGRFRYTLTAHLGEMVPMMYAQYSHQTVVPGNVPGVYVQIPVGVRFQKRAETHLYFSTH